MTELTERAVASRVPSLADEKLHVIARRDPLTVRPGTSLGECLARIRETGTGDSVFVTDADGVLRGVLPSATSSPGSWATTWISTSPSTCS